MKTSEALFGILRVLSDAIAVVIAMALAYGLRLQNIDLIPGVQLLEVAQTLPSFDVFLTTFVLPSAGVFVIVACLLKLYLIRISLSFKREVARIILSTIVWLALVMSWYFFVQRQLFYSRALLLYATVFMGIFVTCGRILLMGVQQAVLMRGIGVRHVLCLGTQPPSPQLERFLQNDRRYKYIGQVASVQELKDTFARTHVDLVVQTDPSSSAETNEAIDCCRSHQVGYAFTPPVLADVPHMLSVYRFGSVPLIRFHPTSIDGWGAVYKRIFDISLALPATLLLSPLAFVIAILIKLDSKGPILYVSKRIGQEREKMIGVCKFRSMVHNADELKAALQQESHRTDGPLFKMKNDPRITRLGRVLRRWSLDELPQLLNVLRGDLSLIGPRPHLPEEVDQYTEFQLRVFTVKPGITGLAQVSGRSDLHFDEEVRLDLQYIEEWSPLRDVLILFRTVWVVIHGKGAD